MPSPCENLSYATAELTKTKCRLEKKFTLAVREISVSWHNGGPIKGPLKPFDAIVLWWTRGFQGHPMMPRDASLLDKCKSHRCCFSSLVHNRGGFLFLVELYQIWLPFKVFNLFYNRTEFRSLLNVIVKFQLETRTCFLKHERMRNMNALIATLIATTK